jgi:AbrB family looped-hinge helix DNA binding protein
MTVAVMSSKGQMTIPKAIRDKLKLKPGDRIEFGETPDGRVVLYPRNGDIRALRGIVPKPEKPVTDEEIKRAIAAGWAGQLDI